MTASRTGTVRFRVTALAVVAVLLVLTVAAVTLVLVQRRLLTEQLEEAIDADALVIEDQFLDGATTRDLTGLPDDDAVAQVVGPSGAVVASSANVRGDPPVGDVPPVGASRWFTIDHPAADGESMRFLARAVATPEGPLTVFVGAPLDDVSESVVLLGVSFVITVPVVTALLGVLVWWLVGRTLRPVEAIRAEVADIGGTDLNRRVPEPATGDEIARLAATMNAMLDRLEQASEQQRRFVADASHELRSPLTRMRSELEVDLAYPDPAKDPIDVHRSVLAETMGLQQLVDDLLHLARSDAGALDTIRDPVDLDQLVRQEAGRVEPSEALDVRTDNVGPARVRADAAQLARAVGNVVRNAAQHATSRVDLDLRAESGQAVLRVTDDGPGVPPEARGLIFDRFARLDESRNRLRSDPANGQGTGLGLAIAREIVERHGGTLRLDPAHNPGARFILTLPLDQ